MSQEPSERTRREIIIDVLDDVVSDFLYYDRKESESLPMGEIEAAIMTGEIHASEIVAHFDICLYNGLKESLEEAK